MIYTLTLNPSLDYAMEFDKIDYNMVNRSKKESVYVGGKGINVSCVLSTLGMENTALGFVAGFTGEEIEKNLNEKGVKTDFVRLSDGISRINVKVLGSGQTTELNATGPRVLEKEIDKLCDKIIMLTKDDCLVIAGAIPSSLPDDIYAKICKLVSERDGKLVVDTTGDALINTLKYKPFLIKPNHIELAQLINRDLHDNNDIILAAKELQKMGAQNVLVSMGDKGAILVKENGESIFKPTIPVKVVNTVGAGDSMLAGFIYGYYEKGDYEYALNLGIVCGAASASVLSVADIDNINKLRSFTKI